MSGEGMRSMRILLVSPANPLGLGSGFPPLSLATIARHVPEDCTVTIVDEGVDGLLDVDAITADLVGITVNTVTARRAYGLSDDIRARGIPTVLGGIHPTVVPDEASVHASAIVVGNGEPAMEEIVSDAARGTLRSLYRPGVFDLAASRVPRRDLFSRKYATASVQTSRGCPFDCSFCSVHRVHGRHYRTKPMDVIERDLAALDKSIVLLVDDNFIGVGPRAEERAMDLLALLKAHRINWIGQTAINIAKNPRILDLCRESGAIAFYVGFESLNDEFLRSVNKSVNLKQTVASYNGVIDAIHDHGICVLGSFIYGTDYDTPDSLRMLRDFIVGARIDTTYVKPLTPFPGTAVYDELSRDGRLFLDRYWLENPYPIFTFKPARLTMEELLQASVDFMNLYTLPRSSLLFGKSLLSTRNLWGSAVCFLTNYTDYREYKAFYRKNRDHLAGIGRPGALPRRDRPLAE